MILLLASTVRGGAATQSSDESRGLLVQDVSAIAVPGIPGPLCVFGKDAATVVAATSDEVPAPLVAASRIGNGRVVAFGHEGYFKAEALRTADTARFVSGAVLWAGNSLPMIKKRQISVAIHRLQDLAPVLKEMATDSVIALDGEDFASHLSDVDVLVISAGDIKPTDVAPLQQFLSRGGGVVAGIPGWGWLQTHHRKTLAEDFPANKLFAEAGIAWADGEIDAPPDRRLAVSPAPPNPFLNASLALDALAAQKLSDADAELAIKQILRCIDSAPNASDWIGPKVQDRTNPRLSKLAMALDLRRQQHMRAEEIRPAPSATAFPGAVPTDAPRTSKEVAIDTSIPGWHSTGLYAAPGELITVSMPQLQRSMRLDVRIGAHSDKLGHAKEWKRPPQIDRVFPIEASETKAANAFGGLIYIVVPDDAPKQTIRVRIEGAVEAPRFVLGETDPAQWRDRIRAAPAPWAELQSDKVIITIPSEHVRKLDDPTELMKFWDRVADASADLASIPHERKRPERYVADVQISAGYMHAGYPIMTHLDAAPRFVDLATLQRDGDWGMFHELGHNHQSADWTFDGTGEVTVNLFTMYVLDTVCTDRGKMHKAMSGESRAKMEAKFRANGSRFEDWKRDPFLALIMYKQLQEAFGWDAYKKVFAEYRALKPNERPKSDDEKRDQFMIRFSRAVGKNLGPFFKNWSIPVSEDALRSIQDLPVWMPPATQPS
jgi:hypothetical protein